MTRLWVRSGNAEIEYEGDNVPTLTDFIDQFVRLRSTDSDISEVEAATEVQATIPVGRPNTANDPLGFTLSDQESVTSLATRLHVQTAPDLVIAACVFLHVCQQKADYTRREILAAMQSDRVFYTQNHSAGLSQILKRLMKSGQLTLRRNGHYTLTARSLETMQSLFRSAPDV